ncbi:MAG: aspartate aminotransferase family protein [Pseudomonadota bacterium]
MPLDLACLLADRAADKYTLHERHLNAQMVRVLKTIGYDVNFVGAEGPYLFDAKGERYLDLLSGFGVFALGRNHPTVIDALRQVLDARLANLVQMDVSLLAGLLAERLLARLPGMERVFFCNSGTEAVEGAIKFARQATGRSRILYCDHAFHGLTYGALSVNGDAVFRNGFGPLLPACDRVPFDDLPALEQALAAGDVAAFVVEPIQGKGVNLPSDSYLPEAARLCRRYGALFVADEIQTGLGRTGRFLALEHWGVEPDMVLLAKALSGGFVPVGAIAMRGWIFAKMFDRMDRALVHGSTFGKNDLAMAAGIATLEAMAEERLVERAARAGDRLLVALEPLAARYDFVKAVRGKGLMIGIEFGSPRNLRLKTAWSLLDRVNKSLFCQMITIPLFERHRVLSQVSGHNTVIKLIPPLVLSEADCDWASNAFDQVIGECQNVTGAVWDLGRSLISHALKARGGAREAVPA